MTDMEANKVRFSYSSESQPRFKRAVIRTVEFVGGQRRLKRLYDTRENGSRPGETFFDVAIRLLSLDVQFDQAKLDQVPATGPVLFIANHPYGVLDGVVLTWLATKVRPDTKVLANDLLGKVQETEGHLLPVDFSETEEAAKTNLQSRRIAMDWMRSGHAIGIFPGGGVSTSERPLRGVALDLPWAPFTAKLARLSKATIVPIHFSGQNSRLFQLASHLSQTLRMSLFFRETARRIGTRLDVRIGEPIPFDELKHLTDRTELIDELRRRTFDLAPVKSVDWMRHGRLRGDQKPVKSKSTSQILRY